MNDNPNLVSSESQNKQILAHLRQGKTITSLEALNLFHCLRLASRICDIKKRLNPNEAIDWEWIDTPQSKKHVKKYFLKTLAI